MPRQRWPRLPCTKLRREMAAGCTINSMPLKIAARSRYRPAVAVPVRSLGHARAAQSALGTDGLAGASCHSAPGAAPHRGNGSRNRATQYPCDQPGALHRTVADTLVSEVLPLAEACRFLEREARWILAPQRLSTHARPFWLRRVTCRDSPRAARRGAHHRSAELPTVSAWCAGIAGA